MRSDFILFTGIPKPNTKVLNIKHLSESTLSALGWEEEDSESLVSVSELGDMLSGRSIKDITSSSTCSALIDVHNKIKNTLNPFQSFQLHYLCNDFTYYLGFGPEILTFKVAKPNSCMVVRRRKGKRVKEFDSKTYEEEWPNLKYKENIIRYGKCVGEGWCFDSSPPPPLPSPSPPVTTKADIESDDEGCSIL